MTSARGARPTGGLRTPAASSRGMECCVHSPAHRLTTRIGHGERHGEVEVAKSDALASYSKLRECRAGEDRRTDDGCCIASIVEAAAQGGRGCTAKSLPSNFPPVAPFRSKFAPAGSLLS